MPQHTDQSTNNNESRSKSTYHANLWNVPGEKPAGISIEDCSFEHLSWHNKTSADTPRFPQSASHIFNINKKLNIGLMNPDTREKAEKTLQYILNLYSDLLEKNISKSLSRCKDGGKPYHLEPLACKRNYIKTFLDHNPVCVTANRIKVINYILSHYTPLEMSTLSQDIDAYWQFEGDEDFKNFRENKKNSARPAIMIPSAQM